METRWCLLCRPQPRFFTPTPRFWEELRCLRVPIQSLFDYLEGSESLDEFLRQFPSDKREQAIAALELARDALLNHARPA